MYCYMQALLWRQWLLKRRSWKSTIMEILSPVLLISLLVVAFYKVSCVMQLGLNPCLRNPLTTGLAPCVHAKVHGSRAHHHIQACLLALWYRGGTATAYRHSCDAAGQHGPHGRAHLRGADH